MALRLSAPLHGHRAGDQGGLGPCLEGRGPSRVGRWTLVYLGSPPAALSYWGRRSLGHAPAGSGQSQLSLFSTPPSGVCLDPGIWGKGHLEQDGDWGWGEGASQLRPLLLLVFLPSLWSWGKGLVALGQRAWWPWPHLWSSQSCCSSESPGHRGNCLGRLLEPCAQATQQLSTTTLYRLCCSPFPGCLPVWLPGSTVLLSGRAEVARGFSGPVELILNPRLCCLSRVTVGNHFLSPSFSLFVKWGCQDLPQRFFGGLEMCEEHT